MNIWKTAFMFIAFVGTAQASELERIPASEEASIFDMNENRQDLEIDHVFQRPSGSNNNQIFMTTSRTLVAMLVLPDFLEPLKRDLQTKKESYEIIKRNRFYSEEDRALQIKKIRNNKNLSLDQRKKLIRESMQAPIYKNRTEWLRARQEAHEALAISNERLLRASSRRGILPKTSEVLKNVTSVWFLSEVLAYGVMWNLLDFESVSNPHFTGLRYYVRLRDKERLREDIDALGKYYEIIEKN